MLKFAFEYRVAIDSITADKSLKLRKFELDDEEWQIVSELNTILGATLFYSQDSVFAIANVIPSMDKLDEILNPKSATQQYRPAIQAAMRLGKKVMNKYYSRTDCSSVYRIAMVLHPGLKLEYFKQNRWPREWIDTAEQLTRAEYELLAEKKAGALGKAMDTQKDVRTLLTTFTIA
ncbi:uncharacterized protein B0H18DRAFT_876771 [Fomitopsis serialis]|uniref:uncharacterized protein n=1 Tax=Fomitopsis serialis TaxID=139415 RepID=UPI002007A2B9|nr:uncharacterized protein B0H18DRAFT_876771 [Neoantrodia serialis]KAH9926054.1 hypothetical protein B0H18DRAFT_876771 [Neoantrodia serialis]